MNEKLRKLYARNDALLKEMRALADKESMTDEDVKAYEAAEKEYDANEKAVDMEKKLLEREAQAKAPENPGYRPSYAQPKSHDKPFQGQNALGEQIMAVINAGMPGGQVDPRLYAVQNATGGSTSVPSDGGFLVQEDSAGGLMSRVFESGEILQRCTVQEIGPNSDSFEATMIKDDNRATGSRWGGLQVYRRAEAATVTATKPETETWECKLEDLMGLTYLTGRQLQDAPAMESFIRNAFPQEFVFKLEDEIIRGTGVGQCLGVTKTNALVSVPIITGQKLSVDPIRSENISDVWARMPARNRRNAVWIYNQELEPYFDSLNMHVGTGGQLVWMPPGGLTDAPSGRFKGRPAIPVEQCSEPGTLGDFGCMDFSEYMIIRKGAIQEASSIHVKFIFDEMVLRWIWRINGKPKYTATIKPYKGTKEKSPFVLLGARSN